MEVLQNFHFLRPLILGLLILPVVYLWHSWKTGTKTSAWEKVCDKKLLQFLTINQEIPAWRFKRYLISLSLMLAILSAAGPAWRQNLDSGVYQENAVFVLLDLSSETQNADNYLTRAKIELTDFLKDLPMAQTGLIVYTNEPYIVSPLSSDARLIINLLPVIMSDIMPANGNRLDRAVNLAVERLKAVGYQHGNIVVFSQNVGESFEKTLQAVQKANADGYKVSVFNATSSQNPLLKQVAGTGGGVYASLSTGLEALSRFVLNTRNGPWREQAQKVTSFADDGYYLLFIPLFVCLYFFRRGVLMVILLMFLSLPAEASFWLSDNYEASRLFQENQYEKAAQKFKNTQWKGVAYYRAGSFENAAKAFAFSEDIQARYNYANALAKSGNLEEAIKIYEEILAQNPNHEDAKFNLEYLKKMRQQQPNKNKSQQNAQQNKNDQNMQNMQNQNNSKQEDSSQRDKSQNQDKSEEKDRQNKSTNTTENQTEQKSDDDSKDKAQNKSLNTSKQQQLLENQRKAKEGSQNEKYDETAQAKEQVYRQIPEDRGGLLRAFIQREYLKNRYGE